MAYQRVEVLTGTERRRSYTPSQKVRMVDEAFRPGVVVTDAARRLGVHESLLYRWRRMMTPVDAPAEPGFAAVTILPTPVTETVGLPVMRKRCSGPTFRRDQGGANLPDRMIGRTGCVYARPYA